MTFFYFVVLHSRDEALTALHSDLFSRSDLPALPLIIIPALVHRPQFPAIRYFELVDFDSTFPIDSPTYENWKLYQLHAYLLVVDSRVEELPTSFTKKIIRIIQYLINGLTTQADPNRLSTLVNDVEDHDEVEQMDVEYGRKVCSMIYCPCSLLNLFFLPLK